MARKDAYCSGVIFGRGEGALPSFRDREEWCDDEDEDDMIDGWYSECELSVVVGAVCHLVFYFSFSMNEPVQRPTE